jgi:hypothetical protein
VKRVEIEGIITYTDANEVFAYIIPKGLSSVGVKFFTPSESDFQLGLMTRNSVTPVHLHRHNQIHREISVTCEFLLIRSGAANVTLQSSPAEDPIFFTLTEGDSVLFTGKGVHGIEFDVDTQILEIKQGPFNPDTDKTYLTHL